MATLESHVKRGRIKTPGKSDSKNTLKKGRDGRSEAMAPQMDYSAKAKSGKKGC